MSCFSRREFCAMAAAALPPSPRESALAWFRAARYGLFIHYGLYSLDGVHPFYQHRMKVPVAEYAKWKDRFTANHFRASDFADLAVEARMKGG